MGTTGWGCINIQSNCERGCALVTLAYVGKAAHSTGGAPAYIALHARRTADAVEVVATISCLLEGNGTRLS